MTMLAQDARSEAGISLVEVLIAMVVMSIGLAAIVAGFSSGIFTTLRAAKASTAGALADAQMEKYRGLNYDSIVVGSTSSTAPTGNGGSYRIDTDVTLTCVDDSAPSGSPPTCPTLSGTLNRPLKRVSIVVRDLANPSNILFREDSTFDASTG